MIVLSSLAVWVTRQALDTGNWVDVSGQLFGGDRVRQVAAADLVDALFANTDVPPRLEEALPPRLDPLAAPAAGILSRTADEAAFELLGARRDACLLYTSPSPRDRS